MRSSLFISGAGTETIVCVYRFSVWRPFVDSSLVRQRVHAAVSFSSTHLIVTPMMPVCLWLVSWLLSSALYRRPFVHRRLIILWKHRSRCDWFRKDSRSTSQCPHPLPKPVTSNESFDAVNQDILVVRSFGSGWLFWLVNEHFFYRQSYIKSCVVFMHSPVDPAQWNKVKL
jgi:hypothetical protein